VDFLLLAGGVFAGVFGENALLLWFFCGQDVVKCVAKMASGRSVFGSGKIGRKFDFIFEGFGVPGWMAGDPEVG